MCKISFGHYIYCVGNSTENQNEYEIDYVSLPFRHYPPYGSDTINKAEYYSIQVL